MTAFRFVQPYLVTSTGEYSMIFIAGYPGEGRAHSVIGDYAIHSPTVSHVQYML